jgi:hypothetical protein
MILTGCTKQAVYEGVQQNQRNECFKLPETERERCLNETSREYEDYKRQRDAVTVKNDGN